MSDCESQDHNESDGRRVGRDGSATLFSDRFRQCYHNPNGALTESIHVYHTATELAEKIFNSDKIRILEVGFGTGLNLWITLDLIRRINPDCKLHYHSIEGFPLSTERALSCGYDEHLPDLPIQSHTRNIFDAIQTPGIHNFSVEHHEITVEHRLFADSQLPNWLADVIFFDAFSPEQNPELWSVEVFKRLYNHISSTGLLTTYCAASKARAFMASAGWLVVRYPGVLGKREITLASPSEQSLSGLKRLNEERLKERYYRGDFD